MKAKDDTMEASDYKPKLSVIIPLCNLRGLYGKQFIPYKISHFQILN